MRVVLFSFVALALAVTVQADMPATMSYQGVLHDSGGSPIPDGVHMLTFRIYDVPEGGTPLWEEAHLLEVVDGVFDVILGKTIPLSNLSFDQTYWMGTTLADDPEFAPRMEIAGAPFAVRAAVADSVVGGSSGSGSDSDWVIDGGDIYRTSGNVGIGTSDPHVRLSLGTDLNPRKLALWDGVNDFYGLGVQLGRITILASDEERMTVTTDGRVGIGTTNPGARLDVRGAENGLSLVRINQWGAASWGGLRLDRAGVEKWFLGLSPADNGLTLRRAASTTALVVDTTGNVSLAGHLGVGRFDPQTELHVYNGNPSASTTLRIENYGDTYWDLVADDGALTVNSNVDNDVLVLESGRMGVGTSSPSSETRVHINANSDDFGVLVDAGGAAGSEIGLYTASSKYAGLAKNAYNVAGNWVRFDNASGAFLQEVTPGGETRFKTAASGGNPIAWETALTLKTDGTAEVSVLNITGGSDLAEPFDVGSGSGITPGMVLSIDPDRPGELRVADRAYDRCVAGVVSGAGGISPGMVMGHRGTLADGRHPVAMTGRVYCLADAGPGAIRPGDLLTTSDVPGHAMKAADSGRAQGAVLGKAMTSLDEGRGLVLVLVALQ